MVAAKKTAEPKPLSGPIVALTVLLAAAGIYLHAPSAAILWLGMFIAAFFAQPPVMTGPKDAGGSPTPIGPETGRLATYRKWLERRSALLPSKAWLPWPVSSTLLLAVGAAAIAAIQPADLTTLLTHVREFAGAAYPDIPDRVDAVWLHWLSAAAAYVVVQATAHTARQFASEHVPAPPVTVVDAIRLGRGSRPWIITLAFLAALAVGGGVFVGMVASRLGFDPISSALAGAGVTCVVAAAMVQSIAASHTLTAWRQETESAEEWERRWVQMADQKKLMQRPRLVSHRRLGPEGQMWVDVLDLPATLGLATDFIEKPLDLFTIIDGGREVVLCATENIVGGEPQAGTRHTRRLEAVSWPTGWAPDLKDKSIDTDLLTVWVKAALRRAASKGTGAYMSMLTPMHDPDAEGPGVWAMRVYSPDPMLSLEAQRIVTVGDLDGTIGADTYWSSSAELEGQLYVGEISDTATWAQPERLHAIERDRTAALWVRDQWKPTLKMGSEMPFAQVDFERAHRLGPFEVHVMPHAVPKGLNAITDYVDRVDAGAFMTTITTSVVGALALRLQGNAASATPDSRFFDVIWISGRGQSSDFLPSRIAPDTRRGRGGNAAAELALKVTMTRAFTDARLSPPLIVSVEALTSPASREHLWRIQVRLTGRNTIGDLRQAKYVEVLRKNLDAAYFRVQESDDGKTAYITAGADPKKSRSFEFVSDEAEESILRLDWEQAFTVSSLKDADGRVPVLTGRELLPKNPQVMRLAFRTPASIRIADVQARVETLRTASGNNFVLVQGGRSAGDLEILASLEPPIPHPARFDWEYLEETDTLPFGTGVDGEPVEYDPKRDAHLGLIGGTGSGKSSTALAIIVAALARQWVVSIVDVVKGAADFTALAPWLHAVARTEVDAGALADLIDSELQRRVALNVKYGVGSFLDLPEEGPVRWMLFFDEFGNTMARLADKPPKVSSDMSQEELEEVAVKQTKHDGLRRLKNVFLRLLPESRSAGITVVYSSQMLDATVAKNMGLESTGIIKSNSAALAIGGVPSRTMLSLFGEAETPTAVLDSMPREMGRGVFKDLLERYSLVQSWFDGGPPSKNTASILSHLSKLRDRLQPGEAFDLSAGRAAAAAAAPKALGAAIVGEPELDVGRAFEAAAFVDIDLGDFSLDLDTDAEVEPEMAPEILPEPLADPESQPDIEADLLDLDSVIAALEASTPASDDVDELPSIDDLLDEPAPVADSDDLDALFGEMPPTPSSTSLDDDPFADLF